MRILVYGAGVIGSILAGHLLKTGNDVSVLARGNRYDELSKNGLILRKANSCKKEITHPTVINFLAEDDIYDYIFVVMQKTQVTAVLPILNANHSKNIVFMVNNPLGYSEWVDAIGKERLMLGFPAAGGERTDGVVSYFVSKGIMRLFQTTTFGEYRGDRTERLDQLVSIMNQARIPSVRCSNMDAWQKTHIALVTSIANLLYKYDSNNYEASKHYKDICIMVRGVKEGFAVIKALGYPVTPGKVKFNTLPTPLIALIYKLLFKTQLSEITMAKHTIFAKSELQCLQGEYSTLIKASGLKTPNIDRLSTYLYK